MVTVEETREMLVKAEGELLKAEMALANFEGDKDEGKLLKALWGSSGRGEVLTADQQQLLVDLTAEKTRLEAEKAKRIAQVEELQRALTAATAQPGNDFVTQALGT